MVIMFAMRDVETQKRGMVGIAYNVGRDHTTDREAVWKAAKIVSILPLRFTGVHYCFDDERVKTLFSLAMYVFSKNARMRCRLHCGSHMECIYHLMTFGIKSSDFPVTTSGEKRLDGHHEFIRKMRHAENMVDDGVDRIIIPRPEDILLGTYAWGSEKKFGADHRRRSDEIFSISLQQAGENHCNAILGIFRTIMWWKVITKDTRKPPNWKRLKLQRPLLIRSMSKVAVF